MDDELKICLGGSGNRKEKHMFKCVDWSNYRAFVLIVEPDLMVPNTAFAEYGDPLTMVRWLLSWKHYAIVRVHTLA